MRMDPLLRFYTTLSAFSIEQTLHVTKMAFDRVVLGLIAMFLLGCSSEGLIPSSCYGEKEKRSYQNATKSNRPSRSA